MAISVPFVDLARMHVPLKERFLDAVREAIDTSGFVMGRRLKEFEDRFASYCGARHCVGVANGTDALIIAFRAADIGPGDEVITVPNSFIATAAAVKLVGAKPVFVDVDEQTQLMDVSKVPAAITKRTKAIVPVHLFGQPADVERLGAIARDHSVALIEDAAQAHGARLGGKRVGSLGSLSTCFSFYPGKNLGALGEAGAIVTDDDALAARMRRIREHGSEVKYYHEEIGFNSRLDAIQAAFLTAKLERLDAWNAARRVAAAAYAKKLAGIPGVRLPGTADRAESVYHLYVVRLAERESAQSFLKERGIGTGIHYPVPIHRQKAFAELALGEGSFPVAEALARQILSLPMFPGITDAEIDAVAEALRAWSSARK